MDKSPKMSARRFLEILSFLLLALHFSAATVQAGPPQVLITLQPVTMLADSKPGMNSDKKAKLQSISYRMGVHPSIFLAPATRLRLIASNSFELRQEMPDPQTGQAKRWMKVLYRCALVEVLDGTHKGEKGWVVVAREVVGRYADVWIGPEPEPPPGPK